MKLSDRLLACASMVRRGSVAADVGTDHGYLALYLLEQGICPRVFASDLREGPLAAARRSAERAGVTEHITFCLSDGLAALHMEEIDTVICAGMGGENIIHILEAEPAVRDPAKQLILQPQSKAPELRRYLAEQGFALRRERLARDGKFLYTVLEAGFTGELTACTPGQQFLSDVLRKSNDPLLWEYHARVTEGVRQSVAGLRRAKEPDGALLRYYEAALNELTEMEEQR